MARIAGIDLPGHKQIKVSLTSIYGIGSSAALKILESTNIIPTRRTHNLTQNEVNSIRTEIDSNYSVEGDRRRELSLDIKRLVDLGNYRGLRHRRSLPVRGQRTKTNARTRKGKKRTIGLGKKAI